jgi:hypothetical protein
MPSWKCRAGDTVFVRATVLEACSDTFNVAIDDFVGFALRVWVPASECARHEDIGELKPIRHNNPRHIER